MLTIGKIGGQGKGHWRTPNYYSEQVVRGAEDYYTGKGEAPGAWAGDGAAALGLEGVIGEGELEAIFERRHPDTGAQLLRAPAGGNRLGRLGLAYMSRAPTARPASLARENRRLREGV